MTKAKVSAHQRAFCSSPPSLPQAFSAPHCSLQHKSALSRLASEACVVCTGCVVSCVTASVCGLRLPVQCCLPQSLQSPQAGWGGS